jgi:hypothetical protein
MCFCNIPHKAKLWKLIDHLFFFVFVSVFFFFFFFLSLFLSLMLMNVAENQKSYCIFDVVFSMVKI